MAIYNTAYKSGTIGSFSGTTVTVSGFTPAAGDVGRLLIINSGSAKLQHREITGVSGQDITIAHNWDTNPFIDISSDSRATDVYPSNGDTIVVSYDLADLIAGDAQLTLTDENHVLVSGVLEASNGAYIHCKNFHIEWNSNQIGIGRDGGIIFGYYGYVADEDGYTKDSCNIVDNTNSFSGSGGAGSLRKGSADFGLFDVYGGSYSSSQATGCFLRGYENTFQPTLGQVRMVDMTQNGNVGGRYDGNRSILIIRGVKGRTTVGIANPTSEVARVELSATDCDQAGYGNMQFAPSGAFVFPQLRDVESKAIRFSGNAATVGIYTAIAKKAELDLIPVLAGNGNNSPNTTLRYGNLVRPTFIDAAGASLSGTLVTRLYDDTGTSVNSENVTGGSYTEFFARHTDISLATSGNKNLSDGTQYAPYTLRGIQYGKQFGLTNISAEDAFESAIVYLDDTNITESTQATVDAYTQLETPNKFYDRAVSWLESNITDEDAFLVYRSGELINAGSYNVDIDATAGSAFAFDGSKITIKASTFTGSITTTGTIALLNGAVNIGTLTDSGGTTTTLQYSITGLVNNSRVQIYNMTTMSEILNAVNGTIVNGTYTEGVEFTIGDTVRLRVTNVIGLVGYKEYESTAVASASGFSFLANQVLDPVYASLAIDGSTITNFTADYINDEADVTVGSDFTLADFYAWWEYEGYSEDGIRSFFGGLTGVDEANFNIHNATVDIKLDNTTTTNISQLDNRRLYRDDLTRPVVNPTSGGGGIDVEWRSPVLLANSDAIEADLESIESKVDLIEVKTEADARQVLIAKEATKFNPALDTVANVTTVQTTVSNTDMRGTDGANIIAPATPTNITDQTTELKGASDRDLTEVYDKAGPADLSDVATRANQSVMNDNVKDSSLFKKASEDLPDS